MPLRCDMRFEKGEKKKIGQRWDRTTGRSHQKDNDTRFTICTTGSDASVDSAVLLLVLYTLIDRCLVQSAVSNLFPNQWRCLKLYLPLLICLICHCVFWLVIMFSGLLLCFLNCYFVFIFAFAFVICYFVFRIVICFALLGHRSSLR